MAKFNLKAVSTIAMAVVAGVAACAQVFADKKKTDKFEELITKVEKLTEEKSEEI